MAKHKHLKHKISVIGGGVLAVLAFGLVLSTTTTPSRNFQAQMVCPTGYYEDPATHTCMPSGGTGGTGGQSCPSGQYWNGSMCASSTTTQQTQTTQTTDPYASMRTECQGKAGYTWDEGMHTCNAPADPYAQAKASCTSPKTWDTASNTCKEPVTAPAPTADPQADCTSHGGTWCGSSATPPCAFAPNTCSSSSAGTAPTSGGSGMNTANNDSPEAQACYGKPGFWWDFSTKTCKPSSTSGGTGINTAGNDPAAEACYGKRDGSLWDASTKTCKSSSTSGGASGFTGPQPGNYGGGQGNYYPGNIGGQAGQGQGGAAMSEEACTKQGGKWTKNDPSGKAMSQPYCDFRGAQGPGMPGGDQNRQYPQPPYNQGQGQPGQNVQPGSFPGKYDFQGTGKGVEGMPGVQPGQFPGGAEGGYVPQGPEMMGGEEGQCGENMVWVEEMDRCEPKMSTKDQQRESKRMLKEIANFEKQGGNQPWAKDVCRELGNIFGHKASECKPDPIAAALSWLPDGSETKTLLQEMTGGGDQIKQCFAEKKAAIEAWATSDKATYQDMGPDGNLSLQPCWELQQESGSGDPRRVFESMQDLRMCKDASRGLGDMEKFRFKQMEKDIERAQNEDVPEDVLADLQGFVDGLKGKVQELKDKINTGDCVDIFEDMQSVMGPEVDQGWREIFEGAHASIEAARMKQDATEFILPEIQKAEEELDKKVAAGEISAAKEEKAKTFFAEVKDLLAKLQSAEGDEVFGIMEQLEQMKRQGDIIMRSIFEGGEGGAFDAGRDFDNFAENALSGIVGDDEAMGEAIQQQMKAMFDELSNKFSDQLASVQKQLTAVTANMTALADKLANLNQSVANFTGNLEVYASAVQKIDDTAKEVVATMGNAPAESQKVVIDAQSAINERITNLNEQIGEVQQDAESDMDKKVAKELGTVLQDVLEQNPVGETKDAFIAALDEFSQKITTEGLAEVTVSDVKALEEVIDREKLIDDKVENGVLAFRDIAEQGGERAYFNAPALKLSQTPVKIIEGNPDGSLLGANPLNIAEASAITMRFEKLIGHEVDTAAPTTPGYQSADNTWYGDAIATVEDKVDLTGTKPDQAVDRGLFVEMLVENVVPAEVLKEYENVEAKDIPWPDVRPDDPALPAALYLHDLGIFNGYPDGTAGLDNGINRAETLKIGQGFYEAVAGGSVEGVQEVAQ